MRYPGPVYSILLPAPLPGRAAAVSMAAMNTPAAGSDFSFLALAMAVFMFGYVVRVADGLTLRGSALAFPRASHNAVGCGPDSPIWPRGARHCARSRWGSPWVTCWS